MVRGARDVPVLGRLVSAADRYWWARVIRRADIVDSDFVRAQMGRDVSTRTAIRHYVGDGFRNSFSLNPLACERTISRQLPDSDRVPALYAYLVSDRRELEVSPAWDAPAYVRRQPRSLDDPAGPLGHLWRSARRDGVASFESPRGNDVTTPWTTALQAATRGALGIPEPRDPDAVSPAGTVFVCRISLREHDADRALALARDVTAWAARVLVIVDRTRSDVLVAANLLSLTHPTVHVLTADDVVDRQLRGADVIVQRGGHADLDVADVAALAEAARTGPVAPLWLAPDGTVASAGIIFHDGQPHHLLADHPAEDARRMGESITVPAIAGETRAWPTAAPMNVPRTLLGISVTAPPKPPPIALPTQPDTDLSPLLAPAGLSVSWSTGSGPTVARTVSDANSLRWAIRTAAPAGRDGQSWGDTHFAAALADALRREGQQVVVDAYEARGRPTSDIDDVTIVLRGPARIDPPRSGTSILWIISHPDEITADELARFDVVFAASRHWAREASTRFGMAIHPLLQCTDATRFRPRDTTRTEDIVFVGTARGIARPSVVEPLKAGIPIKVYGPDWRGFIPGDAIVATGIPNSELPVLYGSARLVLNDHWPAMRRAGFISNRPYDVVAAGGRVVSDHVDGIDSEFEGAVQTFRSTDELLTLLTQDIDERFPDEEQLARISERVRREHSFDARARQLLDVVRSARPHL
jgi:hypothetical protein